MSLPGKILIRLLGNFKYVKGLENRISNFEKYISFSPGHYYSPLVDPDEYVQLGNQRRNNPIEDIELRETHQFDLISKFKEAYTELPFNEFQTEGLRYFFQNDFFSYSDAIILYCMMRFKKPQNIIEIGSGFSSALILDVNEIFLNSKVHIQFIEPNPERLVSLLKQDEDEKIIKSKIQQVDLGIFDKLSAGDFLMIDTSHVCKSGSDVNFIYFNILPKLKKGTLVHIHDIFYPFEYPDKWIIDEKRSWNEIYLLRALLQDSDSYKIIYFNSYMEDKYMEWFSENMPLVLKRHNNNICGGIWLEKN